MFFVIFLTPVQDKRVEFLVIKIVIILHILTKFYKDLLLVGVLNRILDFNVFLISLMLQKTIIQYTCY